MTSDFTNNYAKLEIHLRGCFIIPQFLYCLIVLKLTCEVKIEVLLHRIKLSHLGIFLGFF